uniref:Uncharacterized protein n=1 Tax=Ascaris lumbricoides TaxID=6252 RepID=A0A0M3HIW5_ASCLU
MQISSSFQRHSRNTSYHSISTSTGSGNFTNFILDLMRFRFLI